MIPRDVRSASARQRQTAQPSFSNVRNAYVPNTSSLFALLTVVGMEHNNYNTGNTVYIYLTRVRNVGVIFDRVTVSLELFVSSKT